MKRYQSVVLGLVFLFLAGCSKAPEKKDYQPEAESYAEAVLNQLFNTEPENSWQPELFAREGAWMASYYGVKSPDLADRFTELFRRVYESTEIQMTEVRETEEGFTAIAEITTIDVLTGAQEAVQEFQDRFTEENQAGAFRDLTDEEYQTCYGEGILTCLNTALEEGAVKNTKLAELPVIPDDNGSFSIADDVLDSLYRELFADHGGK